MMIMFCSDVCIHISNLCNGWSLYIYSLIDWRFVSSRKMFFSFMIVAKSLICAEWGVGHNDTHLLGFLGLGFRTPIGERAVAILYSGADHSIPKGLSLKMGRDK